MDNLSKREKEVANLISKGYTVRDIAEELGIVSHTVEEHLGSIYDKLELNNDGHPKTKLAILWKRLFG